MRKFSLVLALLFSAFLVACGGGGGGGGGSTNPSAGPTPIPILNQFLASWNSSNRTTTVQNFPASGLNYATQYFTAGKFGSPTAECYISQTQQRNFDLFPAGGSSLTLVDPPAYVYCAQTDGTVKEVSQQLFGQYYAVQGEYPVVGDLNNDGVDDIFLLRQCDCAELTREAHVFMSQPGGTYAHQLINIVNNSTSLAAGTQFTVMDINRDGCKDIVGALKYVFTNNCAGLLVQDSYEDNGTNNLAGFEYSTAACAGDFNNSGHDQILFADRLVPDGQMVKNAIIDFDSGRNAVARYDMPVTYFGALYNSQNGGHSFACRTADINNDGKLDLFIYTSNFYVTTAYGGTASAQSYVQTYLNTSTNGVTSFEDISAAALPAQSLASGPSYSPRIVDMNNDGFVDLVLDGPTYNGIATAGNQVWINNKNNTFSKVFTNELTDIYTAYAAQFGGANTNGNEVDTMLPIKVNGKWNYLVQLRDKNELSRVGIASTEFVFK